MFIQLHVYTYYKYMFIKTMLARFEDFQFQFEGGASIETSGVLQVLGSNSR